MKDKNEVQPKSQAIEPVKKADELNDSELDGISGGFNRATVLFQQYDKLVSYAYPFVIRPPR